MRLGVAVAAFSGVFLAATLAFAVERLEAELRPIADLLLEQIEQGGMGRCALRQKRAVFIGQRQADAIGLGALQFAGGEDHAKFGLVGIKSGADQAIPLVVQALFEIRNWGLGRFRVLSRP